MHTFIFRLIPGRQRQVFLFSLNILLNILLLSKMWRLFYVDLKILFSSLFKAKAHCIPTQHFSLFIHYMQMFALTNKYHHESSGCFLLCGNFKCVTFQRCVRGTTKLVYYSTPAQRVSVSDRVPPLQTRSGCRIPNLIFTYPVLFAWKHGGTRLCIFSCTAAF